MKQITRSFERPDGTTGTVTGTADFVGSFLAEMEWLNSMIHNSTSSSDDDDDDEEEEDDEEEGHWAGPESYLQPGLVSCDGGSTIVQNEEMLPLMLPVWDYGNPTRLPITNQGNLGSQGHGPRQAVANGERVPLVTPWEYGNPTQQQRAMVNNQPVENEERLPFATPWKY